MKKIFGIIASLCLLVGCVSNRPTILVPDPSESFSFVANDHLEFSLNVVGIETTYDVDTKGNTGSYLSGVVIKNTEKVNLLSFLVIFYPSFTFFITYNYKYNCY